MKSPTCLLKASCVVMVYLFVFLIGLLGDQLGLGQLSLQDGDPVVLHVALVLKSLSNPISDGWLGVDEFKTDGTLQSQTYRSDSSAAWEASASFWVAVASLSSDLSRSSSSNWILLLRAATSPSA